MVLGTINTTEQYHYFPHAQLYNHSWMSLLLPKKDNIKKCFIQNEASKAIHRSPKCLIESDQDFILDKIKSRDTIEYDIKTSVDDRCE